jgi:hypothetical protein
MIIERKAFLNEQPTLSFDDRKGLVFDLIDLLESWLLLIYNTIPSFFF